LIACVGAYVLAIHVLHGNRPASLAAAMFYGLSGYFAGHSQHVGMVETAAWLPWLVLAVLRLGECANARRLAVCAIVGAAIALPGHFQTALYAFCGVAVWALVAAAIEANKAHALRAVLALAATALWGGAMAAGIILPRLELTPHSLRAGLNAADSDLGYFQLEDLLTLVHPDHYGVLLGSGYTGPGDVTQHYLYAGLFLAPLALVGLLNPKARKLALLLGLPFIWYALGPVGGAFNVAAQLPGFRSVELPMHGWFLPALGLALLGGAGLSRLPRGLATVLIVALFVDLTIFNSVQNRLTFARSSAEELYDLPLQAFQADLRAQQPPVQRLYGPALTSVVYRNHALQSRVETTYGYHPLELAGYTEYVDAADQNPRLADGFAANYYIGPGTTLHPISTALPLVYFARRVTAVADEAAVGERLLDLDPAAETLIA